MGIVLCLVYGSFMDIFRIFAYHYVSYLVMELGGVSRDVLYTDVLCTACKRESSVLTLSLVLCTAYLSYLFVLSYFSYVLYFSLVSTLLSLFFAELFLSFFSDLLY